MKTLKTTKTIYLIISIFIFLSCSHSKKLSAGFYAKYLPKKDKVFSELSLLFTAYYGHYYEWPDADSLLEFVENHHDYNSFYLPNFKDGIAYLKKNKKHIDVISDGDTFFVHLKKENDGFYFTKTYLGFCNPHIQESMLGWISINFYTNTEKSLNEIVGMDNDELLQEEFRDMLRKIPVEFITGRSLHNKGDSVSFMYPFAYCRDKGLEPYCEDYKCVRFDFNQDYIINIAACAERFLSEHSEINKIIFSKFVYLISE